jgi:hypothetical protein
MFKKNAMYDAGLGNLGAHFGRFSAEYTTAGGSLHRATWWQFGRRVYRHRVTVVG